MVILRVANNLVNKAGVIFAVRVLPLESFEKTGKITNKHVQFVSFVKRN